MNRLCYSGVKLVGWLNGQPNPITTETIWRKQSWQLLVGTRTGKWQHLQNRVNSLFRDMNSEEDPLAAASFVPAVDIYEDAQKVVLKLEVPGIEEKDLDVRVENHTLTVKGKRKFEKEEKEENFHRIERRYGNFYRAFTLPSTVDTENVGFSLQCRRSEVGVEEEAEAQPKQIKINVDKNQTAAA